MVSTRPFLEACKRARTAAGEGDLAAAQGHLGDAWRLLEELRAPLKARGELRQLESLRDEFRGAAEMCRQAERAGKVSV